MQILLTKGKVTSNFGTLSWTPSHPLLNIISILSAWHQLCCDVSQLVTDTFQTLLRRVFEKDLICFSYYLIWLQERLRWRMWKQCSQLWTWTWVKGREKTWEKNPRWAAKHKQCDKTFQNIAKLFLCLFKTNCFHEQQNGPASGCLWVYGLCPQNLFNTATPSPHNPCDISMKSSGWLKATRLTHVSQDI